MQKLMGALLALLFALATTFSFMTSIHAKTPTNTIREGVKATAQKRRKRVIKNPVKRAIKGTNKAKTGNAVKTLGDLVSKKGAKKGTNKAIKGSLVQPGEDEKKSPQKGTYKPAKRAYKPAKRANK